MKFEWDPRKAVLNLAKHGVSFEEVTPAFRAPLSATARDPDHSVGESRFVTFGLSSKGRLLIVSLVVRPSDSSLLAWLPNRSESFMKKGKSELNDWLRPEYKRSDFGEFVRGKYANRIRHSTNVVVLDPQVAKVFPNDEAVNNVLRGLIELARSSTHLTKRSRRR